MNCCVYKTFPFSSIQLIFVCFVIETGCIELMSDRPLTVKMNIPLITSTCLFFKTPAKKTFRIQIFHLYLNTVSIFKFHCSSRWGSEVPKFRLNVFHYQETYLRKFLNSKANGVYYIILTKPEYIIVPMNIPCMGNKCK